MATMKKTKDGTVFAATFEIASRDEVGIVVGIYSVADIASIETLGNERVLLINDDGVEIAGVRIVHTDNHWNPKED